MPQEICMHCLVSGIVQGVSYRYHTRKQALHLGVSGWVRNLSDGRVEVLVSGETKAVEQLCVWLHQGPAMAQVTTVECKKVHNPRLLAPGFTII